MLDDTLMSKNKITRSVLDAYHNAHAGQTTFHFCAFSIENYIVLWTIIGEIYYYLRDVTKNCSNEYEYVMNTITFLKNSLAFKDRVNVSNLLKDKLTKKICKKLTMYSLTPWGGSSYSVPPAAAVSTPVLTDGCSWVPTTTVATLSHLPQQLVSTHLWLNSPTMIDGEPTLIINCRSVPHTLPIHCSYPH